MKLIPYIALLSIGLCAVVQASAELPALTPAQEQAMQKDVQAIQQQALLLRTIRDASSADAAYNELCHLRAQQTLQKRHLQHVVYESRAQFRAVQARFGWTEQDSLENKLQTERLAVNRFYGVKKLAIIFGLSIDYARPVEEAAPQDNRACLLFVLRTVHNKETADAAAPRVAELVQACKISRAEVTELCAEVEHEVKMLHAEYVSLLSVDFYGSSALREALNNATP